MYDVREVWRGRKILREIGVRTFKIPSVATCDTFVLKMSLFYSHNLVYIPFWEFNQLYILLSSLLRFSVL